MKTMKKSGLGQSGCWIAPKSGADWVIAATPPVLGAGVGAIVGLLFGRTTGGTLLGLGVGIGATVLMMSPLANKGGEGCPDQGATTG